MSLGRLAGRRVIVVEDELLVAMMIEDTLRDQGCDVIGPFSRLSDALEAASHVAADAALLDVYLRGEKIYPVAELLAERGIPFLLLSGYGDDAIPEGATGWRALGKPFEGVDLVHALVEQIEPAAEAAE